jgi:hypothetical protein
MLHHLAARAWLIAPLAATAILGWEDQPARAQGAEVLQSQETNESGITGEITEAKRKDGVLTIKLRLRNAGGSDADVSMTDGPASFDNYYVTAADKKYFVLRDSEGKAIATNDQDGYITARVKKDGTYTWWAKFPAPPAEVTSVSFYTPIAPPFEDIPITD